MKISQVICQIICLVSVFDSVSAQESGGGFFRQIFSGVSDVIGGVGDFVAGALDGGLGGLVSDGLDFIVLNVAAVVIGEDPEELACDLIQEELSKQEDVSCTCNSDITVATTTAELSGTCDIPRTCPVQGVCGACSANYDGTGDVAVFDQAIDGSALVTGSCALDEITTDIGASSAMFDFTATLNFDGGFSSLDVTIGACTTVFMDLSGATLGECECSPDGCGPLEISFTCGGSLAGLASDGCVSLTGLGGN